ncbi:hypothetical protein SEA_NANOSMITE_41 [Mycobacterium phage Nanosmite]|nr:hypothetical protein SEA_NANOSMITE_41 [Mycobacterium phage Nanosmite]
MNVFAKAFAAAIFPLLWEKLEPLVEKILKEKLDELVPDQIDKQLPKLVEEMLKSGFNLLGGWLK